MEFEVFISHASEDKDAFVGPLAASLVEKGLKIWYDEYVLKVGDSIRDKINEGLHNCDYGIVVLSHSFYAKEWPKAELNALYHLMMKEPVRRVLPVLYKMTPEELIEKDALLAGILAADATKGIYVVVRQLVDAMIRGAMEKRLQGKTQFKHRYYDHNYYRPPEDIQGIGYRFDPPYELERLEAALRPREILMCFLRDPKGEGWNSACHITCRERLLEFQKTYGPELELYAVDIERLRGKFDHPFTDQELSCIRKGV